MRLVRTLRANQRRDGPLCEARSARSRTGETDNGRFREARVFTLCQMAERWGASCRYARPAQFAKLHQVDSALPYRAESNSARVDTALQIRIPIPGGDAGCPQLRLRVANAAVVSAKGYSPEMPRRTSGAGML